MFRIIIIVVFLTVFVLGASFSAVNTTPVTLNYYIATITLPLAVVVIANLSIGILLGAVLVYSTSLKRIYENRRLTKKITSLEQEIDAINSLSLDELDKKSLEKQ